MNKNQNILRVTIIAQAILTLILPNLFFLLIKFEGYWMVLSALLGLMFFIGLSVATVLLIIRIIKYQQWRHKSNYFALAIALVFLCIYLLPFRIVNENTLQSPVKIKARFLEEKSMVCFRENGRFEVLNTGRFGYIHYFSGIYTQKNDSLFLDFKSEQFLLGDTLIINDNILYKVQNGGVLPLGGQW